MKILSDYTKKNSHIHLHENIKYENKWGHQTSNDDYFNALIDTKNGKINIFGYYQCKEFDRLFKVGDVVEYDSYNLSYLGTIVKVGPKSISVDKNGGYDHITKIEIERMNLHSFIWRNYDFNLEETLKSNTETSYCI